MPISRFLLMSLGKNFPVQYIYIYDHFLVLIILYFGVLVSFNYINKKSLFENENSFPCLHNMTNEVTFECLSKQGSNM